MLGQSVPVIEISLAPPQECLAEPCSPFNNSQEEYNNDDNYRPTYLSPPLTHLRFDSSPKIVSPLGRPEGKGLDEDRFAALLKAARDRKVPQKKQKEDLRKEILSTAHKNKQIERRALFLSKLAEPPSPSATLLPKTPPESPSVFHYTLPSPGLVSPLALFESLNNEEKTGPFSYARSPWIEQVDYRLGQSCITRTEDEKPVKVRRGRLPSLDEISARLQQSPTAPLRIQTNGQSSRLPAFLAHARRHSHPTETNTVTSPPVLLRRHTDPEVNSSRERKAQDMFSALSRRTGAGGEEDKRTRRRSAPAELTRAERRSGFEHPVLSLPGGF